MLQKMNKMNLRRFVLKMDDQIYLQGSKYHTNLVIAAAAVKGISYLNDVTIACDDGEVFANKFVLFSGSEFFQSLFQRIEHKSPYIFLKNTKLEHLKAAIDFMYEGKVCVNPMELKQVLNVASDLKIEGLRDQKLSSLTSTKVSNSSDDILDNTIIDNSIGTNSIVDNTFQHLINDTDYETALSFDEKALDMMEKRPTVNGTNIWLCKFCGKNNRDKTRIRKHVIGRHLKTLEKVMEEQGAIPEDEFYEIAQGQTRPDNNDLKAALMMKLLQDTNGRDVWYCNLCDKFSYDKTRIRIHIKTNQYMSYSSSIALYLVKYQI